MRYTILGRTGLRVSALGFGCMRLPTKDGRVDRDLSTPMLRRAVELGVNFFDSATMYCYSDSESALGEAMEGIRDRVVLSTKNPHRGVTPARWRAQLEESLKKLRTDHIDIYNHHGINWGEWGKSFDPANGGLTREMLKAKEEGLIRHAAFSFHDAPDGLKKLADTGYYDSVICQYNLIDQANADAINYAHAKGMGVIVMGPVGGGRLGIDSTSIHELTGASSTVEAALRFVWAHPGVNVALSGMQTMAMLEENVRLAETAQPFTAAEVASLNTLVRQRKERSGLYCSGCKYCVPVCSVGLPIPEQLELLNQALIFGLDRKEHYQRQSVTIENCANCGKCIQACPQKLEIPTRLREAAEMWDPRFGSVIITPVLEQVDGDGKFHMTVRAHNFARLATPLRVSVASANGADLHATADTSAEVEPFARKKFPFTGRLDPAGDRLALRTRVDAHEHESHIETSIRYLLAPAADAKLPDWTGGVWHSFRPTAKNFTDGGATAALHSARFRVARAGEVLVIHAEVEDDFLCPSRPDRDKGSCNVDGLELYLDGRTPARIGLPAYEDGVWQVMVYPGTPQGVATHPAFHHVRKPLALEVESFPWDRGYRLAIRLPFAAFCVAPELPRKIGFDLAVNTANAVGARVGQYFFAGDTNNWRDAAKFTTMWMV